MEIVSVHKIWTSKRLEYRLALPPLHPIVLRIGAEKHNPKVLVLQALDEKLNILQAKISDEIIEMLKADGLVESIYQVSISISFVLAEPLYLMYHVS